MWLILVIVFVSHAEGSRVPTWRTSEIVILPSSLFDPWCTIWRSGSRSWADRGDSWRSRSWGRSDRTVNFEAIAGRQRCSCLLWVWSQDLALWATRRSWGHCCDYPVIAFRLGTDPSLWNGKCVSHSPKSETR